MNWWILAYSRHWVSVQLLLYYSLDILMAGEDAYLLFANASLIQRVNFNGSSVQPIINDTGGNYAGLDIDIRRGIFYASDNNRRSLIQAATNGSDQQIVLNQDIQLVESVAWDWINGKLYWCDRNKNTIEVVDPVNRHRAVLHQVQDGSFPHTITVDPVQRWMYWSQWSEVDLNLGKINRISMDGTSNIVILDSTSVTWPTALTLDHSTGTLYFIDSSRAFIAKSNTSRSNLQVLQTANNSNIADFFANAMDVFEEQIYFTERHSAGIHAVNVNAPEGNINTVRANLGNNPGGIRVVNISRQPLITNPCAPNNGGCSHLCLLSTASSSGYSCVCPDGVDPVDCFDQTSPHVPDRDGVSAIPMATSITVSWSFATSIKTRTETYTVLYGTTINALSAATSPVQSVPGSQQYSTQLLSLQPGTMYYYQILSINTAAGRNASSAIFNTKTVDAKSSGVANLTSASPNSSTLVFTWQPPASPNGEILYYMVNVFFHQTLESISGGNIVGTSYTVTNLAAGVPYSMIIWPANLAGAGDATNLTRFTTELTPELSPRNFTASRRVSTTILLFWVPLTLSEAKGFVTSYTVSYRRQAASSTRQLDEQQVTAIRNNGTVILGVQGDATYLFQVWASTAAGAGQKSPVIIVRPPSSAIFPVLTASIIGAVAGLALMISVVILVIVIARGHRKKKLQRKKLYEVQRDEKQAVKSEIGEKSENDSVAVERESCTSLQMSEKSESFSITHAKQTAVELQGVSEEKVLDADSQRVVDGAELHNTSKEIQSIYSGDGGYRSTAETDDPGASYTSEDRDIGAKLKDRHSADTRSSTDTKGYDYERSGSNETYDERERIDYDERKDSGDSYDEREGIRGDYNEEDSVRLRYGDKDINSGESYDDRDMSTSSRGGMYDKGEGLTGYEGNYEANEPADSYTDSASYGQYSEREDEPISSYDKPISSEWKCNRRDGIGYKERYDKRDKSPRSDDNDERHSGGETGSRDQYSEEAEREKYDDQDWSRDRYDERDARPRENYDNQDRSTDWHDERGKENYDDPDRSRDRYDERGEAQRDYLDYERDEADARLQENYDDQDTSRDSYDERDESDRIDFDVRDDYGRGGDNEDYTEDTERDDYRQDYAPERDRADNNYQESTDTFRDGDDGDTSSKQPSRQSSFHESASSQENRYQEDSTATRRADREELQRGDAHKSAAHDSRPPAAKEGKAGTGGSRSRRNRGRQMQ